MIIVRIVMMAMIVYEARALMIVIVIMIISQ